MQSKYIGIFETLKAELADGGYRVGEVLPSVETLCRRFGAGAYAVRHALALLRDDGLVALRQNVGAVVSEKVARAWKGRVLFVAVGVTGSYYTSKLYSMMADSFGKAGWDMEPAFIESRRTHLDVERVRGLVANGISFAVIYCSERQITDILDHAKIPYVVIGGFGREYPNARGVMRMDSKSCYDELICALKRKRLKSVLEVDFERVHDRGFKSQMFEAGICVRRVLCKWDYSKPLSLADVRGCGYRAVAEFFAEERNRRRPPEMILFDDDYLACGGISALLELGFRIPKDVRLAVQSNAGNELALGVPLTRLQLDPAADAERIFGYVSRLLSGRPAAPPRLALNFIPGESL